MISPVAELLRTLEPISACAYQGLHAVRLAPSARAPLAPELAVASLEAAVRTGAAEVTEVDGGRVGQVAVHNRGGALLFGMMGELVVGGRQDRVLTASVLVAPGATARVAVSCVESRRWDPQGVREVFRPARATASPGVRAAVHATGVWHLERTGLRESSQRRVWSEVDATLRRTGCHRAIPTGALTGGIQLQAERLEDYVRHCAPEVGVAEGGLRPPSGLALFAPGRPGAGPGGLASLDCFAAPHLLAHYAPRLVRGAALEALGPGAPEPPEPPAAAARALLARLAEMSPTLSSPAAGGAPGALELHYAGPGLVASVLCYQGRPIHLAVSPAPARPQPEPEVSRPPRAHLAVSPAPARPQPEPEVFRPPRGHRPGSGASEGRQPRSVAALEIREVGEAVRVLWLTPGAYVVGRSRSSDIRVGNEGVSRRHAQLVLRPEGSAILRDLGSTNGVEVNGEPVVFSEVRAGDRIDLGGEVSLYLRAP